MIADVAPALALADFTLPAELEAHDPPEARGLPRDGVRMLVSRRSSGEISHHGFRDLPGLLLPGDLLVNNAGTLGASPLPALADYPPDELRAAFEVNVIAPIALTQLMLPLLRVGGAVLNITSDAAVEAYAGWGGYGAAKAALEQASNVLAAEELGVRVWWADPGDLRTDMHQLAFPGEDISDRPEPSSVVPAFVRLVSERLPSGRYRAAHLMPREPASS